MPAKVTLIRTSERDIKMRDLYVTLDEEPERTVLYGRATTFEVAPGEHRLKITNRLYSKTETFTLAEGEEVRFRGANVWMGGPFAWMLVALTSAYKVTLERD